MGCVKGSRVDLQVLKGELEIVMALHVIAAGGRKKAEQEILSLSHPLTNVLLLLKHHHCLTQQEMRR